jgi:2,4-dienoyl-CoA reductase-like NADH-dependent reductase (Old Yellow Enzyme family)
MFVVAVACERMATLASPRATPLTLPCGAVLLNRLCKSAMLESLADPATSLPTSSLMQLYRIWGATGTGLLITGNVMVDGRYMENPRNVSADAPGALPIWRE